MTRHLAEEAVARRWYGEQQYERSLAWLLLRIDEHPEVRPSYRHLMVAETLRSQGKLAEAERHARIAAGSEHSLDTRTGIMDAGNTNNMAWKLVATLAAEQGKHWQATLAWARWTPSSWCGNCMLSQMEVGQRELSLSFWRVLTLRGPLKPERSLGPNRGKP